MAETLPEPFADLEPLAEAWALPGDGARNRKRLAADFDEIRRLYETVQPRLEQILDFLDRYTLDDMPEDARRLFRLALAYCEVAPAVELFRQPAVVDGFEPARFVRQSTPHMDPAEV